MGVMAYPLRYALADLALALSRVSNDPAAVQSTAARAAADMIGDGAGVQLLRDDGRYDAITYHHIDDERSASLGRVLDHVDQLPDDDFSTAMAASRRPIVLAGDGIEPLAGEEHLLASIGKPTCGVDLRLVDAAGDDVPDGEVGEIVTRADAVMSGYLDDPDGASGKIVDGWYHGGDLAWRDAEGYLYLSGRRSDTIIRGGENVYPAEVESVLAELPGVLDVAVVGVPDEHWGEVVRAHLVLRDGAELDREAAVELCRSRLAAYKVPVEFRVEPDLPRNATGKVLRRTLRLRP